ncbi:MAG: glycogen/starch/alpha-glucan family phosphorylase [Syntrophorhabdales bacterium]|jgi:starch phosphorylase
MERKKPSVPREITNGACEDVRLSSDPDLIARAILENLGCVKGRTPKHATMNDWYTAVARTVCDRLLDRWVKTLTTQRRQPKIVSYLSAEFLLGPHLGNAMINLGIYGQVGEAVTSLGLDLDKILDHEQEPGLGSGGLGRLAACFLDSLATLRIPAIGYGIRYEFGIFDQEISDGWQKEITDKWLAAGNPWEISRPEIAYYVNFAGHTEYYDDEEGLKRVRWVPYRVIKGVAFDTPIPGYDGPVVDLLRLWKSEAAESFDFQAFNVGDYYGAVEEKVVSETLSKVLYPNDEPAAGKKLRLGQQYFFVSCSLHDMIRIHELQNNPLTTFHEGFTIQLNDTHPSIAIAELMRILVDERRMDWDLAWSITQRTFAYTNHTLLPEALEKWPVTLFRKILPRHLEIIFEINRRFLDEVRRTYPGDEERVRRLSIIDEPDDKYVRMAHLAMIGSHAVNGVAELHTELLKETAMRDFYEISPGKFHNITNGTTPRRWVALSNPGLTGLITEAIGDKWISRLEDEIQRLERFADDTEFRRRWREVKQANKANLAGLIKERTGVAVDIESIFDVQAKRVHEYKRQHLNILHVITLYRRLKNDPSIDAAPRTVIFGGKAAPGYFVAKLIIKHLFVLFIDSCSFRQAEKLDHVSMGALHDNKGIHAAELPAPYVLIGYIGGVVHDVWNVKGHDAVAFIRVKISSQHRRQHVRDTGSFRGFIVSCFVAVFDDSLQFFRRGTLGLHLCCVKEDPHLRLDACAIKGNRVENIVSVCR